MYISPKKRVEEIALEKRSVASKALFFETQAEAAGKKLAAIRKTVQPLLKFLRAKKGDLLAQIHNLDGTESMAVAIFGLLDGGNCYSCVSQRPEVTEKS